MDSPHLPALTHQRLALAALVPALILVACSSEPPPADQQPLNVLLISLDTLRRDHVGAYNPAASSTPNLDAFAANSLRFDQAFTHHPWTLTAHATMLSGLYPLVHGLLDDRRMNEVVHTMPEVFSEADYATMALVDSCGWLDRKYGLDQGFATYDVLQRNAEVKVDALFAKLDSLDDEPFFVFTHFFDAHSDFTKAAYEAKPEFLEEYAGWYTGDYDGSLASNPEWGHSSALLKRMDEAGQQLRGDDLRYLQATYAAGVRTLDEQLGRLFEGLDERGLLTNTIVAIVADHGEALYEHGAALHSEQYDEVIRIPFILRVPGADVRVSDEFVGLVDLAPTLLALASLPIPADMQGRSLEALLSGAAFSETMDHVLLDNSMFLGRRSRTDAVLHGSQGYGLFDMLEDPGQMNNLIEDPSQMQRMKALDQWRNGETEAMRGLRKRLGAIPGTVNLGAEELDALHGIGYTGE